MTESWEKKQNRWKAYGCVGRISRSKGVTEVLLSLGGDRKIIDDYKLAVDAMLREAYRVAKLYGKEEK